MPRVAEVGFILESRSRLTPKLPYTVSRCQGSPLGQRGRVRWQSYVITGQSCTVYLLYVCTMVDIEL